MKNHPCIGEDGHRSVRLHLSSIDSGKDRVRSLEVRLAQAISAFSAFERRSEAQMGRDARREVGLLTEDEAIEYLRLDTIHIADPKATLRRYRERGLLRGTQISKKVFYRKEELDAFVRRLTDENPR